MVRPLWARWNDPCLTHVTLLLEMWITKTGEKKSGPSRSATLSLTPWPSPSTCRYLLVSSWQNLCGPKFFNALRSAFHGTETTPEVFRFFTKILLLGTQERVDLRRSKALKGLEKSGAPPVQSMPVYSSWWLQVDHLEGTHDGPCCPNHQPPHNFPSHTKMPTTQI